MITQKTVMILCTRASKLYGTFALKKPKPIRNYNIDAAEEIKNNVNLPVIVVGGIRDLNDMETIIE